SGGAGKTLVATNLAVSLQQQDSGRVLFIDASYPLPADGVALLGLDRAKSLGDMVPILARLTPEVMATYLVTAASGIAVMPLLSEVLQSRLVTQDTLGRMFDLAGVAFDLIVIDMPPGVGSLTPALVERSDYVCVVSDCTPGGVARTKFCFDFLRSQQVPNDACLLCLNRVPDDGATTERIERMIGIKSVTS